MSRQEIETAYLNALVDAPIGRFRIETGDEKDNIMLFYPEDVSLLSIMNYIDEKKAAQNSGLLVPPHLRQ